MAKKIQICRKHNMGYEECQEFAARLLDKLVDTFGGNVSCVDDNYQYQHSTGIKAVVEAREKDLNVHVKLGLLTSALAPKLSEEINRVLDDHLDDT